MGQGTEMCPICEENQSEFGYIDYAFFVEEKEFNNLRKNKNHKKKDDYLHYPNYEIPRICIWCLEDLNKDDKIIYNENYEFIFIRIKDFQIIKYISVTKIQKEDCNNFK